jgi:hypothetical protein
MQVQSSQYTGVPHVFYTPYYVAQCCTKVTEGHCCITLFSNNDQKSFFTTLSEIIVANTLSLVHCCTDMMQCYCCAAMCSDNGTLRPSVAEQTVSTVRRFATITLIVRVAYPYLNLDRRMQTVR